MKYEHALRNSSKSFFGKYPLKRFWCTSVLCEFSKIFEIKNYSSDSDVFTLFKYFENNTHLGNHDVWACSVKIFKIIEINTHQCDSGIWACSVKFVEIFENTHRSDFDLLACSVKFVEIFESHTHLSDSDVLACSVNFIEMFENISHWS